VSRGSNQCVEWAAHRAAAELEHVGVDHGRCYVRMPEQSCTVRMSYQSCSRCVAKQCHSMWGVAGLAIPASATAPKGLEQWPQLLPLYAGIW
jgi:hypothetical protein